MKMYINYAMLTVYLMIPVSIFTGGFNINNGTGERVKATVVNASCPGGWFGSTCLKMDESTGVLYIEKNQKTGVWESGHWYEVTAPSGYIFLGIKGPRDLYYTFKTIDTGIDSTWDVTLIKDSADLHK